MPDSGRRPSWRGGLILLALLAGCDGGPRVHEKLLVWNTEATIDVVGVPPAQAQAAIASAAQAMTEMSREWHAWKPSAVTRINEALARGESAPAPPSVIDLIERSRPLVKRSGGLFDPGIGGLVRLWGFHTETYPIQTPAPDAATLQAWLDQRPSLLDLRIENDRVSSSNPRLQLDFGAVGEPVALERGLAALRAVGVENVLITLGGDMAALGTAGDRPWRVALQDPIGGRGARLADLELRDSEGLFSSGNYARFREAPSGERWPHVLDPRTGRPATGVTLTAVISSDLVRANAASTALMSAGAAGFADLVKKLGMHCALLLTDQNELLITRGMQARIQLQRQPVALGQPIGNAEDCAG